MSFSMHANVETRAIYNLKKTIFRHGDAKEAKTDNSLFLFP